jgi:biopolymer transport protein TolR
MAFSMAGGGPSRPEINVTPLIDVLLVLIIVFMVIVATTKEYKVDALLPQPGKPEQPHQNERTIVIQTYGLRGVSFHCSKSIRNPYLGSNWNRIWNESS